MRTKTKIAALIVGITLVMLGACQSSTPPASDQTAASSTPAGGTGGGGGRHAASSAPATRTVTAPAGTTLSVSLGTAINTGTTQSGSAFDGTLADAVVVDGVEVAPAGSAVEGQVTNVVSSGRLSKPAEVSLELTSITPTGGAKTSISTSAWAMKAGSHTKRDAALIGGGAGVGALVGALAGHGKGAAIGALVGGGAGTAGAAMTGKKEIALPAETKLTFKLASPASFQVRK